MTETIITETATGRVVAYAETAEERAARVSRAGAAAARALQLTKGQRRTLAKARVRRRS